MKKIKDIVADIHEELDGAEHYAKKALEYREEDKPLADALNAMAMQELSHVDALHAQVVRIIKDYRATGEKPPEAMMAIWDWEHGKAIDHQARVKSMIDMYKK